MRDRFTGYNGDKGTVIIGHCSRYGCREGAPLEGSGENHGESCGLLHKGYEKKVAAEK